MKKSDCIIGQYYSWYEYTNYKKPYCIIKYTEGTDYDTRDFIIGGPLLKLSARDYDSKNGGLHIPDRDVRLSTPDEIRWLDACIKVGKWVEEPKITMLPIFN